MEGLAIVQESEAKAQNNMDIGKETSHTLTEHILPGIIDVYR